MAHKIIAADLGSSCIKLARFDASFRKMLLLDVRTFSVSSEGSPLDRVPAQLQLLAQTIAQEKYEAEEIAIGLPGDVLTFRIVDLPFSNPKQIEQTIGYELESLILTPVDELVVDFVIVGPARSAGGVTAPETRVLAACAPRVLVEKVVKTAQELLLPLRQIGASTIAYAALLAAVTPTEEVAPAPPVEGEGEGGATDAAAAPRPTTTLVVNVGAESTAVCILQGGRPELARSIARGGRHVSDSIAAAFKLDPERAEQAKRDAGFIAHRGTPRLSPSQAHMDAATREALGPLVRELRQTLAAYRATYGDDADKLYVTGGGARLPGIIEFLGEELELPAARLPHPSREGWAEGSAINDKKDLLAVAIGLGLSAVSPGSQVNFRKGEFAYRSDYSFLRDKATYFAVAATLIFAFAGLSAWTSYRGLKKDHEQLAVRLKKATVDVFGKERDDASSISEEVKIGPKGIGQLPIPSTTAFDLLDEISHAVPPPEKIRLDILELDIRPKKTTLTATTETAQQVDDFGDSLKKVDCYEDVQKGKLATITPPQTYVPPDQQDKDKEKKRPTELKQFTISVKASCP